MTMTKQEFVQKVQRQLKAAEAAHELAGRKIAVLHETLSEALEQFGGDFGIDDGVVASIITPKNPGK